VIYFECIISSGHQVKAEQMHGSIVMLISFILFSALVQTASPPY